MRIPPLPTTTPPVRDGLAVTAAESSHPASPVVPRSLPPLVYRPAVRQALSPVRSRDEPKQERRSGRDRRQQCRRYQPLPLLLDPRQWGDRRKHGRRANDQSEHVDDWV